MKPKTQIGCMFTVDPVTLCGVTGRWFKRDEPPVSEGEDSQHGLSLNGNDGSVGSERVSRERERKQSTEYLLTY